ncbi:glycosyltransferase family 2 protein [Candidatus Bathyarchaeota archaeon]|nr:glycosyltransferase family 2 protein [Candidatus Bathyarchaeota archaeon]MBS7628701.1 glycosyltransferase family 2 protein [Candidatus Bathyarchaeota archaeon]
MKVDVVFLTRNSVNPYFTKCLDSLYRNVDVNRLLVIDEGSTDGTLERLSKYPNVHIYQVKGGRAVARQKGIELVETDWHLHLDSDVVLCDRWQEKAERHIDDDVGAIWGVGIPMNPHVFNWVVPMRYVRRMDVPSLMIRNARRRGGTHDTLLRTGVVKDIKIPSDLHIYEDWYIKRHVENKGYRFLTVKEPYCYHYSNPIFSNEICRQIAMLDKKYGIQSFLLTARNLFLAPAKCCAILLLTRDRIAMKSQWDFYWRVFKARMSLELAY